MKRPVLGGVALAAVALAGCAGPASEPPAHITTAALTASVVPTPAGPAELAVPPMTAPPQKIAVGGDNRTTVRASRAAGQPRPAVAARPAPPRPAAAVGGDVWGALARCESGGNPQAVGGGGRYYGAFQMTPSTWRSLGYSGLPTDHSYGTQLAAAQRLQARSGWGQWPHCSRKLGLR